MAEKEEGALSRWSRLKRGQPTGSDVDPGEAVEQEALSVETVAARTTDGDPAPAGAGENEDGEAPVLREEDLPDIDSLTYDSDFTAFMQEGVPLALRNRALAMLWKSNPLLANVDGLNDYDLDYTIKEFELIASESAEDLRSGKKRESAHERRRAERDQQRELRRSKTTQRPAEVDHDDEAEDDPDREAEIAGAPEQRQEAEG